MSDGFRFRQFSVRDNRCAMRVGTDGVLLGAWVNVGNAKRILDIGTGCGLIALMMAQRNSTALIDAIEIDADAAQQASENVAASPWSSRIEVFHNSLEDFVGQTENASRYDIIVCNPPFFTHSTRSRDERRSTARHQKQLTLAMLFSSASAMLSSVGRIALIVPKNSSSACLDRSNDSGLDALRTTDISPFSGSPANRVLMEFGSRMIPSLVQHRFVIYESENKYTEDFWRLTGEFYLSSTHFLNKKKSNSIPLG